jgi:hypothetical protein
MPLRELLCQLTRKEDPEDDEIGYVFGMLMLGLQQAGKAPTVKAVIETAQQASPSLIRLLPCQIGGVELNPEFAKILAKIEYLQYRIERGFFSWEALGTSGVLPFSCLSQQFVRFQKLVIGMAPATFDKFEELLP